MNAPPAVAFSVLKPGNDKVGDAWVLYRSVGSTCPLSCPRHPDRKDRPAGMHACYASSGHFRSANVIRSHALATLTPPEKTASEIRRLPLGAWLRLTGSGDLMDPGTGRPDTALMDAIAEALKARPDVRAWSYSHAWRYPAVRKFRDSVPNLQLFASVESIRDRNLARKMSWRVAFAGMGTKAEVQRMPIEKRPRIVDGMLACISQTLGRLCSECGFCVKARKGVKDVLFFEH